MDEITARLVGAHAKLVEALTETRRRFDAGADDWEHSLLRTMREYMLDVGIEKELIDPLQRLLNETNERILKGRRKSAGKSMNVRSVGESLSLTFAAACVTILKERAEYDDVAVAAKVVSRACGLDRKTIEEFRKNVGRSRTDRSSGARVPVFQQEVVDGYWSNVRQVRGWTEDEILGALARLRRFC